MTVRRTVVITVRLTESEAQQLRARADSAGCSVSAYVRALMQPSPTDYYHAASGTAGVATMGVTWNEGSADGATVHIP